MGLMVFAIMVKIVFAGNSNLEIEVFGKLPSYWQYLKVHSQLLFRTLPVLTYVCLFLQLYFKGSVTPEHVCIVQQAS